ncbi:MAG: hypothetical protein FWE90_11665 [Defluviitaleaceae bacterium]|nr:hypothetical protein [Defluviitaleaceae bacterium]
MIEGIINKIKPNTNEKIIYFIISALFVFNLSLFIIYRIGIIVGGVIAHFSNKI